MKTILTIVFGFMTACKPSASLDMATKETVMSSVESWLKLVDDGEYDLSWDHAAGIFKSSVSKNDWNKMIRSVRPPLGKVLSRTVKSQTRSKSLPGVPDGDYVVIQFETSFENKADAIETITPAFEKDGTWRVSGYYIN